MDYQIVNHPNFRLLQVSDLLNEVENREVFQVLKGESQSAPSSIVVDIDHLDFVNSVGLSFLLSLYKETKAAGGSMLVVNSSESISQLLTVTKLNDILRLCGSMSEAQHYFDSSN